jgi:glycosyltransferase involved in cell wall biosynthesis
MKTRGKSVAYLMSRFPVLTETFILYEMLALRNEGFDVSVFPLRTEKAERRHPETEQFKEHVYSAPLLSLRTVGINLKWLVCHPVRYIGTAVRAAAGTAGSLKFFAGALLYYPKAVVFAERARRMGIDHVHAHFCSHPAMAAWVMHRLCGISYSFTAHGTDLHVYQQMLGQKAKEAAFAVTVSDYNIRFIEETCGKEVSEKFEVIRCGTDTARFRPRSDATDRPDPLEILCIASLRPVKGHAILMDACAELKRRGIRFRCRLVGSGPEEPSIRKRAAECGLTDEVSLEGEMAQPGVMECLARADVITLTSVQTPKGSREGVPVALMEGMACGLPVVASRISGIPELVEEGVCGLLFTPGDAEAAADALAQLAADFERCSRMGRAARQRVEQSFDLQTNARQLAERIEQYLDGSI